MWHRVTNGGRLASIYIALPRASVRSVNLSLSLVYILSVLLSRIVLAILVGSLSVLRLMTGTLLAGRGGGAADRSLTLSLSLPFSVRARCIKVKANNNEINV